MMVPAHDPSCSQVGTGDGGALVGGGATWCWMGMLDLVFTDYGEKILI